MAAVMRCVFDSRWLNVAALRLFGRAGFADTGYIDPDAPDSRWLDLTRAL